MVLLVFFGIRANQHRVDQINAERARNVRVTCEDINRRHERVLRRQRLWRACENKRWPAASCYQGYNRWECTGGVRQMKLSPWLTFRNCSTYITVAQGVATLRDNTCF